MTTSVPDKLYFRIGEVGEIVGVEPHVLRYWEAEFPSIRPRKSRGGQRLYRRNEVLQFITIRRLLHEEGFTIAGARKRLKEEMAAAESQGQIHKLREIKEDLAALLDHLEDDIRQMEQEDREREAYLEVLVQKAEQGRREGETGG